MLVLRYQHVIISASSYLKKKYKKNHFLLKVFALVKRNVFSVCINVWLSDSLTDLVAQPELG